MKRRATLATLIAVIFPLMAAAHTELKQATPANGSVIATPPAQIMLMFSQAATVTKLTIQKTGDMTVQNLGPLPKAAAEHFMIAAPKLGWGSYVVTYRAVSDDNHVASGTVRFTISADAKAVAAPIKPADMKHMDHASHEGK
jgi:methionine-rich copper-binding protein CopC